MSNRLIECVPNISEGRNEAVINAIVAEVKSVEAVILLDVDPGKATNRTVITFVGEPEAVIEAAFRLIKKSLELIDMSKHKGEHPRMGATDVCPLIPISGISMKETVEYARRLGDRLGKELGIAGYYYEEAASRKERRNLAANRAGEYEGVKDKLNQKDWAPDFGSYKPEITKRFGAINVGVRDFLVAYNINLNTTSSRRANSVAFDIREKGRVKREGNALTGKIITDEKGNPVFEAGSLKSVKGIGWYIEEYGIAQISLNLTNISITPVHIAFDEACKKAEARGMRVTGSELVGLIPLKAMLDAGKYYLAKQQRSLGVSEKELIKIAIKSLGLDDLGPFDPEDKIIEYVLRKNQPKLLVDLDLTEFADETASESPAPGGGSIAAYVGALGASLGTMVANLSSHKRGWDDKWEYFSKVAEVGQQHKEKLLFLVDEDTRSFNRVLDAFRLPQESEKEKNDRKIAIEEATKYATEVPLMVMKESLKSMDVMLEMVQKGLKSSLSDGAVGALCARTSAAAALLNVRINAAQLSDRKFAEQIVTEGEGILKKAEKMESEILSIVNRSL